LQIGEAGRISHSPNSNIPIAQSKLQLQIANYKSQIAAAAGGGRIAARRAR